MCAEVCIHESENWQVFFFQPLVSRPLSTPAVMYPERGTISELYH